VISYVGGQTDRQAHGHMSDLIRRGTERQTDGQAHGHMSDLIRRGTDRQTGTWTHE